MKLTHVRSLSFLSALLMLVVAIPAFSATSESADTASSTTVEIDTGVLRGEVSENGMRIFRGIPFAAPPVGELRWAAPEPAARWQGERDATRFGAICPQPPMLAVMTGETFPETSEDCLFLNVWTEAEKGAALPVMVWIHGGGLTMGWSNQIQYEGTELAKRGVVLVSINYRLGSLGYLAHPALSAESKAGTSGNYGFLDQVAALEWVKRNIGAFGGDPNNVTIFGESAGGTSVHALVASPLTKGLIHRAISQSAWITETNIAYLDKDAPTIVSGEAQGTAWSKRVSGKDDVSLAELRALDSKTILQKEGQQGFQPYITVGDAFMPTWSEERFRSGDANRVPLIAGTNTDEGTMFQTFMPIPSREAFEVLVAGVYGDKGSKITELYPSSSPETLKEQMNHFITDTWFLRGTRNMLVGASENGSPTYQYTFTRRSPVQKAWGAHHAAELSYVFNTLPAVGYDKVDADLADAMIQYWVQFAKTGDPNVDGLAAWPKFDAKAQKYLELGETIAVGEGLGKERCDTIQTVLGSL
jgi:para-nitrobenzyl esterase